MPPSESTETMSRSHGVTRAHDALTVRFRGLEAELAGQIGDAPAAVVAKALADFEAFTRKDREKLLVGGLVQTQDDRTLCEWVSERYDQLASIAGKTVPKRAQADANVQISPAPYAVALLAEGHAGKWRRIAGRTDHEGARARLHKLFRRAIKCGAETTVWTAAVDLAFVETHVEALYVRALLIERFAGGNLTPRRLEILDSWLLAWMDAFWLTREPDADVPSLCVDAHNPAGSLIRYEPNVRADFFLSMNPLQRCLDRAVRAFHDGVMFPGWGIGQSFRIDEHVAVIHFLEREFEQVGRKGSAKSKRFAMGQSPAVRLFAGFNDVYSQALETQTVQTRASANSAPMMRNVQDGLRAGLSDTGRHAVLNTARQPITLLDISETGIGLELVKEDAALVEIDELVALQIGGSRVSVLGVVVRKTAGSSRTGVGVGIRILCKVPLRVTLEEVSERIQRTATKAIFVPGIKADGGDDSMIVPDAGYQTGQLLTCIIANDIFNLKMGHVRHQGRGWKQVSIETLAAR